MTQSSMVSASEGSHIRSAQPYFPPDEIEWVLGEIRALLENGNLTQGSRVREFERAFAEYVAARHAIAVSSGTAALEIILRHFSLHGAEVIVPTNTFLASANAVISGGGTPVFADIEGPSLCVGVEGVRCRCSERTRGVMVVHIAGLVCPDLDAIRDFCRAKGFFLIEDAAHAHGATRNGRKAGSLADAAAFSFFPTKLMTTAEGGMITTNDESLAEFARCFRNHGVPAQKKVHEIFGLNYRLDELRAVLGISQLRMIESFLAARQKIARQYEEGLSSLPDVTMVRPAPGSVHSYYKFPILLRTAAQRSAVAESLRKEHGIESGSVYWPPCHLQPVVQARSDLYAVRGTFPVAEDMLRRVLCLPIHARMDSAAVARVIGAVKTEAGSGHCG
jgi:dTDP-4-amino-4,6-dideoxygalactose transaminase